MTYRLQYLLSVDSSMYDPGQAPSITVDLIFYWDHPFSASTSTYEVGSNPPWFGSYYLNPPSPTGHDQEVTYVTRLNDYGFDPKQWMASLSAKKPDIQLRNLFIPGSHDSGTYQIHYGSNLTLDYENWIIPLGGIVGVSQGWAKAQNNSIFDQLNAGMRYLDLRFSNGVYATSPSTGSQFLTIGPDDPVPYTPGPDPQPFPNVVRKIVRACHSYASASPDEIISDVQTFLNGHPKEVVFLNFQHFYNFDSNTYQTLIQHLKNTFGTKLLTRTSNINSITLKSVQASGKQVIVFFDSNHVVTVSGEPESGTNFKDAFPDLYAANDFIWSACDFLENHYPDTCKVDVLKTDLQDNIYTQNSKFYVMQGIITPDTSFPSKEAIAYENGITGKHPKNLEQLGNEVSPQVCTWVNNEWNNKPLNIILLDWVCNSMVTQICYMLNRR